MTADGEGLGHCNAALERLLARAKWSPENLGARCNELAATLGLGVYGYPRNAPRRHHHPVLPAAHPRRRGLQIHLHPHIQPPPPAPTAFPVIARAPRPAHPATLPPPCIRAHPDHEHLHLADPQPTPSRNLEPRPLDDNVPIDTQQPLH